MAPGMGHAPIPMAKSMIGRGRPPAPPSTHAPQSMIAAQQQQGMMSGGRWRASPAMMMGSAQRQQQQQQQQSGVQPPIMPTQQQQQQQGAEGEAAAPVQPTPMTPAFRGRGGVLGMAPPPPPSAGGAPPSPTAAGGNAGFIPPPTGERAPSSSGSPSATPVAKHIPNIPMMGAKVQAKPGISGMKSSSSSSLPEYIPAPHTSTSPSPGINSPKGMRPRLASGITAPPAEAIFTNGEEQPGAPDDVPPPPAAPGQPAYNTHTLGQTGPLDNIANMDMNIAIGLSASGSFAGSPNYSDNIPPPSSSGSQSPQPGSTDQLGRKMSSPALPQGPLSRTSGSTTPQGAPQFRVAHPMSMQNRLVKERSNSAAPFANFPGKQQPPPPSPQQQQHSQLQQLQHQEGAGSAPYAQVTYHYGEPLLTKTMTQNSQGGAKAGAQAPRQLFKHSPKASIVSRNKAAAAAAGDSRGKLAGTAAGPEEGGASSTSSIGILTVPIITFSSDAEKAKTGGKRKEAKKIDVLPSQIQFDCFRRDQASDEDGAAECADINAPRAEKAGGELELGENERYKEFPQVDFAQFYEDGSRMKEVPTSAEDAAVYEDILNKVSERNEFFMDEATAQAQIAAEEGSGIPGGISIGSGTRSPASSGSPRLSVGNASDKRRSRVGSSPFAPTSGGAGAGGAGGSSVKTGMGSGFVDDANVPHDFEVPTNLYGCKREELGAALVGNRAHDEQMQQIGFMVNKIPQDKQGNIIKVLVCGDPTANKGSWLVKLLGYGVLRNPTSNVLSRRVWLRDTLYYVEFKLSSGYSEAETDRDIAWANAFVLLWDVESRVSYDAIPQLHQDITHQKNKPSLPMVIVMGNSRNADEATWSVSRGEADSLQDMLSLPSLNGTTTEEVVDSFNRLIEEFVGFKANLQQQQYKKRSDSLLGTIKRSQSTLGIGTGVEAGAGIDKSNVKGELEFVVLGDAFVGKTAFMKRISEKTFAKSYNATSTKIIRKKNIELTSGDVYSIRIIDTPGYFVEKSYVEGTDVTTTSSTTSSIAYSSASTEAAAAAAAAASSDGSSGKIGSAVTRGAATSTVNWLKQESLLQSQAFIAMFSMTSYQSFEYACDLIDHIQTARMETPDAKAPIVFLVGNKDDLTGLRAVDPQEIHNAAGRLGCSYSIISCRAIEDGRIFESLNRIVEECNIIGKAQVQEQARKPTLELYSKQGYLLSGKEKRKCKTKTFFYVHDGVLQYGSNEKDLETLQLIGKTIIDTEAPPNNGISQAGGAGSNNAGTEANIHITVGPTNLWILAQPEVEKLSWEAAIKLNMIKGKMQDSAAAGGAKPQGAGAAAAAAGAAGAGNDQQFSADDRHSHRSLFKTHHKKKE